MAQLTDVKARSIKPGDKPIGDGAVTGLQLHPGKRAGHGKWILRFVSPVEKQEKDPSKAQRRDMGLGTYPETGVAAAREKATQARQLLQQGKDPLNEKEATKTALSAHAAVLTFEQAARRVHEDRKTGWKNPRHATQWLNTLQNYIFLKIGSRKVDDLKPADFADALRPIWLSKAETASRVKQRCHAVMKWCWAQGLVTANPVDVVDLLLPQQPSKSVRIQHQPSLPWRDIPAFYSDVLKSDAPNVTRALLEFVILTAARSGEARGMCWDEVDLTTGVWTVSANRMKTKKIHRVPLSQRAVEMLERQRKLHPNSRLVFPTLHDKQLDAAELSKFLRDHQVASAQQGRTATAHGFRSSFRDWASENEYPRDWAERALSHTIKNQVEAAYHRTDLLEQRRGMMEAWAGHVCGHNASNNVVNLADSR